MTRSIGGNLILFLISSFRLPVAIARWTPVSYLIAISLDHIFHSSISTWLEGIYNLNGWILSFTLLSSFKFFKVIIHTISFLLYRPFPIPARPTILGRRDVTVIIPTVGDLDEEFKECIRSILANNPHKILVCTVGDAKLRLAEQVCHQISPGITCVSVDRPSKRQQIYCAVRLAHTSIIVLADDHVFWGPDFLRSALAPFEDLRIGGVATSKRVRRAPFSFTLTKFCNFIACNYLERHNFECTATNNIDRGFFIISGRTALYRASILESPEFEKEYLNETWLFGAVGPMNVDDDNMITRYVVNKGLSIHFQNSPEARIETTFGNPRIFLKQCDRWVRSTWRSNSTSLFADQTVWKSQPWCVYAVYLSSFVNFALFYDFALFYTLYYAVEASEVDRTTALASLTLILFISKMIKPFPHFWRHPKDLIFIPGYILFGYFHSLVKLKALLTVTTIAWGSRAGIDGSPAAVTDTQEDLKVNWTFQPGFQSIVQNVRRRGVRNPGREVDAVCPPDF